MDIETRQALRESIEHWERMVVIETRRALRESIEHWERMRDKPWAEGPGSDTCPLCRSFWGEHGCRGCVVATHTGRSQCHGTPYYIAQEAYKDLRWGEDSDSLASIAWLGLNWRIAAQKEIDFLKSLEE